jgi:hypothetical protein
VTTRHIRRETERDPWLTEVSKDRLSSEFGGAARAVVLKQAVADDSAIGTSLWMTVESLPANNGQVLPSELLDEFEWQFGFKIPRSGPTETKKDGEKKESAQNTNKGSMQNANPSKQGIEKEYDLITKAREVLKSKETNRIGIKDVAEAWNLADTEIWRFVRAYRYVLPCPLYTLRRRQCIDRLYYK